MMKRTIGSQWLSICCLIVAVYSALWISGCNPDEAPDGSSSGFYTLILADDVPFLQSSADGAVLSNKEGEIVWSGPLPAAGDSIVTDLPATERLSLTILNSSVLDLGNGPDTVFRHLTYADLPSGAMVRVPIQVLRPIETVTLTISGVSDVQEVTVRSINNQNTFWSVTGSQLTVVCNRYAGDALAVYIRANGEDSSRVFLTDEEGDAFTASWQDLSTGIKRQIIQMPVADHWTGGITGVSTSGTRLELYGLRNIGGAIPTDSVECWYPTQLEPVSFDLELNGLFSGLQTINSLQALPSSIQQPYWVPDATGVSPQGLSFSPDTGTDFWECTWRYDHDNPGPFPNMSVWRVIGLSDGMEAYFTLPEFSEAHALLFPTWDDFDGPDSFELIVWGGLRSDKQPSWSRPQDFLDRNIQAEWGLTGVKVGDRF